MRSCWVLISRQSAVVLAAAWLGSSGAWACSCAQRSVEEDFVHADAVFSGRAVAIAERPYRPLLLSIRHWLGMEENFQDYAVQYGMRVRFDVEKSWKGGVHGSAVVYTGRGDGDCGFTFDEGGVYVVFARRSPSGPLHTTFCNHTDRVENGGDALAFLARQPATAE